MNHTLSLGFLHLIIGTTFVFGAKIDPALMERLAINSEGPISTVIHFDDHYDLSTLDETIKSHEERTRYVWKTLEAHTQKAAQPIIDFLENQPTDSVHEVRPLWITHSLAVKAEPKVILEVMALNGISEIRLDSPKEIHELGEATGTLHPNTDAPTIGWGIENLRADELWKKGIRGKGIKVGIVDTGINIKHPDLMPNLWVNPGESGTDDDGKDRATNGIDDDNNGYVDDVHGYDFEGKDADIMDEGGHGSKVSGIVAGTGVGGVQTGVAPEATIVGIRTCCGQGTKIFETNTWEGLQYAIKVSVRVISMSLSAKPYSNPSFAKWRRAGEVMLKAGVVHVNSAGNLGSNAAPKNMGAPCSNPPAWFHPDQKIVGTKTSMITIGATDQNDRLRAYSSTGPVTWEAITPFKDFPYASGEKMGLTKPEVCGPSEVPSTNPTGAGYAASFSGTSSATPHIAAVTALLLSAHPHLNVAQVTETLVMSAKKVGTRFNNQCGGGRVDSVKAVEYAAKYFKP